MEEAIRRLLGFPCQQRAWLGEKVAGGVTDLLTKAFASDTKRAEEVGLQASFLRRFPTEKYHALPSISILFATQREGEASVPVPPSPASSTRTSRTTQIHDLAFEKPCFSLPRPCVPGGNVHCLQPKPVSPNPWAKRSSSSSRAARSSEDRYGMEKQSSVSAASTFSS